MLCEHGLTGECFHSFFEFPQTSTSVSILQLDYRAIVDQGAARVSYHA